MKILLVTYRAYPRISGKSTYITMLKDRLKELGHEVDVLAHKPGLNEISVIGKQSINKNEIRKKLEKSIEERIQNNFGHLTKWLRWRETERYIFEEAIKQMELSSYDIIHAQDIASSNASYRANLGIPLITSFHNYKVEEWKVNQETDLLLPIERTYIAREEYLSVIRPEKVMVPSQWLKKSFVKLGVPESKIEVIHYGINIEQFRKCANRHSFGLDKPKGKIIILCPARLVQIKGHTYLFQALERLKALKGNVVCWIAGSGVLMDKLKGEADDRKLSSMIRFLGERDDIPALLSVSDLVVLPTLHDTLPFVIMEAQIAGIPVISTTVGGIPEMIEHGQTGLLCQPKNVDELYESILYLIENPEIRRKISEQTRKNASEVWDFDRFCQETLYLYSQTMNHLTNKSKINHSAQGVLDLELLNGLDDYKTNKSIKKEGNITGMVQLQYASRIKTIYVHLLDISSIALRTTSCDQQGNFAFHNVPVGSYNLMAVCSNKIVSCPIEVKPGNTSNCNIDIVI